MKWRSKRILCRNQSNQWIYGIRIPFTNMRFFDYKDPERWDIVVCDPPSFARNRTQLRAAEKEHGGLVKGVLAQRKAAKARPIGHQAKQGFLSFKTGIHELTDALQAVMAGAAAKPHVVYMSAQGGNCGVGYIGGYNGSNIAGYGSYAYSVVSDGKDAGGSNLRVRGIGQARRSRASFAQRRSGGDWTGIARSSKRSFSVWLTPNSTWLAP